MEARARALLLILPLLIAAAAVAVFAEGQEAPRRTTRAEHFSRLIGGPVELDPLHDAAVFRPVYAGSDQLSSPWPSVPVNGLHPGGGSGDALRP